jgi:hypothetical protein
MTENTMTLAEIRERLWATRGLGGIELGNDEFQAILESLDHLSRPVSVSDEDVQRACRAYSDDHHARGYARPAGDGMNWHMDSMRAALESALGVTK